MTINKVSSSFMLDQAVLKTLRSAMSTYYTLFKVDQANTFGYACLNQYYATGRRTIAFHSPDFINNGQEVALLWSEHAVMTLRERALLQARYHNLPSVLTPSIDWPSDYGLDQESRDIVGKILSVCNVRRRQIVNGPPPLEDLEPASLVDVNWLFNRFPNAIYMGVRLGKLIPQTTLRTITKFYIIADPNLASILN